MFQKTVQIPAASLEVRDVIQITEPLKDEQEELIWQM